MTAGLWKTDVKAIGLQMGNDTATLYCPITIAAYFEQVPLHGLTDHSINSTIPEVILEW